MLVMQTCPLTLSSVRSLAYKKYHHVPLYLEWAPADVFTTPAPPPKQQQQQQQAGAGAKEPKAAPAPGGKGAGGRQRTTMPTDPKKLQSAQNARRFLSYLLAPPGWANCLAPPYPSPCSGTDRVPPYNVTALVLDWYIYL